jgi:hypothetical protein
MSRIHHLRRRVSHSTASHERARGLAADRLLEPLEPTEARWLAVHLAACDSCRAIAAAYDADRMVLRSLRDRAPEPPRDLWARTAAAIERESSSRGGASRRGATTRRRSMPALGVLSGVAVIAVVIGASILSGGFLGQPKTADIARPSSVAVAVASSASTPGPTPIAVGAGSVGWVGTAADGALAYNVTDVNEVCPAKQQPDCAPVPDGDSKRVEIAIRPKSISQSPVKNQAVVVGTDSTGDDAVLVIALPTTEPTATPTSPTIQSAPPVATASPTATPTALAPSSSPTRTPPPASSATPSATSTAVATPTASATATSTVEPTSSVSPSASPTLTPEPTVAATLAIVSGVKVVGESAAYSPNGAWFAFTARPSDDSAGPDIYVWRVGEPLANRLTKDHASVFASWAGNRLLGSRPAPATAAGDVAAESFFVDPTTGEERAMTAPVWRPIVNQSGDLAVGWEGTLELGPNGLTTVPATGALVLRPFDADGGPDVSAKSAPVVAEGSFAEFDVRWDETGTWLAIWLADATDPAIGRLSLVYRDPATGRLDRPEGAPQGVTALPGFSIADGRLAWATPPGQGGEGSRVQIVAWTDASVGAIESGPVEDVVVIH